MYVSVTSGPAAAISSGIHALEEARVTIETSALGSGSIRVPYCINTRSSRRQATSCINSNDALSELWSWRQIRHRLNSFDVERLHIRYLDRAAFFQIVQIPT